MPPTHLAGDRRRQARNPRDLTGRAYSRLHAEHRAKQDAASLDIGEIRRQALTEGIAAGFDRGFAAGWDALAAQLVEDGILDPDEPEDDQ